MMESNRGRNETSDRFRMKKVMMVLFFFSVGNIPPGVNPEAYQWFQTVDTDRSGFINNKELKQALVNSNWSAFNDETCLMMISKS